MQNIGYKVGQKFMVEMREGYHLSKIVRREIESEHRGFLRAFRISEKGLLSLSL